MISSNTLIQGSKSSNGRSVCVPTSATSAVTCCLHSCVIIGIVIISIPPHKESHDHHSKNSDMIGVYSPYEGGGFERMMVVDGGGKTVEA